MSTRKLLALFLLCGAPALAQTGRLSGPVAGYVYDWSAGALRPVRGVPGAATLGDPLAAPWSLGSGFVAPRQDLAVLVSTDGSVHWITPIGKAAAEVAATGSIAPPRRVVFSPTGTAAALVASDSVQVVTGLPSSPALAGSVTLDAATEAAVSVHWSGGWLAVSDDGAWLLLASGNGLRLIAVSDGNGNTLMPTGRPGVVAFAPGSHDAALASDGAVTWIHDAAGSAVQQAVAQISALAGAVGVAFSADGATLYAANAAGSVWSFDLAAGTGVQQSSGAVATTLEPMGGLFRLNQAGAGPLWLVDPNAGSPRIVFVPPAATSN